LPALTADVEEWAMRRVCVLMVVIPLLSIAGCRETTAPGGDVVRVMPTQRLALTTPLPSAQVSAGIRHTCALKTDGTVVCWGRPDEGATTIPSGLGPVAQVGAGSYHTCALLTDGTVTCWGWLPWGLPPAGLSSAVQLSVGYDHQCVVKSDRTAACWGRDDIGQSDVPAGLGAVAQISAGQWHTCALKVDGTVVCWGGYSYYGPSGADVPPGLTAVVQVSAMNYHTCVLKSDRTVLCWGIGEQVYPPAGLTSVAQVSAGSTIDCAIKTDQTLVCWGYDVEGDLVIPPGLGPVLQVSSKEVHTCAVRTDGTVACWGGWNSNIFGEATVPAGLNLIVTAPQSIAFTSTPPVLPLVGATYAASATATSGLAVSLTSLTPTTCTFAGGTATFVAAGPCTIAADQAGNSAYYPAPEQTQSITVITAAQAIQNLLTEIAGMGLPAGTANSLSAPLNNVNTTNAAAACGKLNAFVNQVNAKSQSAQLIAATAARLVEAAKAIMAGVRCA
jgi:alpha-tubulin suppressor-like RCC1 family protein